MRILKWLVLLLVLLLLYGYYHFILSIEPQYADGNASIRINADRFSDQPVIFQLMDSLLIAVSIIYGYTNINGSSLLKVPDWIGNPLGKYYLYFSHHKGEQIRMAYSDTITGPYQLYPKPVLHLSTSTTAQTASEPSGFNDLKKYTRWTEMKLYSLSVNQPQKPIRTN